MVFNPISSIGQIIYLKFPSFTAGNSALDLYHSSNILVTFISDDLRDNNDIKS